MKPQLLIDCQNPEELFASPEWCAEEKLDGDRLIVVKRGNSVECFTRTGNRVTCDLVTAVAMLCEEDFTVDGELMPGGQFIAFDVASFVGIYANEVVNEYRAAFLRHDLPFHCVRRAETEEKKRALFETIRNEGGEGIVFKRKLSTYKPGQRTDDWQRHKLYETEPFTVGAVDLAKSSFEVIKDGKSYGSVACGMNRLPLPGETVRVRYEKITAKGKLLRARLAKA